MRIARALYESLPYAYIVVGAAAAAMSYLWRLPPWSDLMAAFGVIFVIMGLVLVLRRRDYRIQKRHYGGDFDEDE